MDRSALRNRLSRLALAWVVAFVSIGVFTVAGSVTTAQAAAPAIGCGGPNMISVTAPDGSARCVENTCEAVMGVEGRADLCTAEGAASESLSASVPAAGETGSGVAPVAAAAQPAAARSAAASADDVSLTQVLTWASAALGLVAAIAAGSIFLSGRRARVEREHAPKVPAA